MTRHIPQRKGNSVSNQIKAHLALKIRIQGYARDIYLHITVTNSALRTTLLKTKKVEIFYKICKLC
jgi:hypothetical protein